MILRLSYNEKHRNEANFSHMIGGKFYLHDALFEYSKPAYRRRKFRSGYMWEYMALYGYSYVGVYICMSMYVMLCMYRDTIMATYVWLCMYGYVCMAMYV